MATREAFHAELAGLERDIVALAVGVKDRLAQAVAALEAGDAAAARAVVAGDRLIDLAAMDTEQRCLRLLALQQPVAGDLRTIGAALRILIDLERIADHAASIGGTVIRMCAEPEAAAPAPAGGAGAWGETLARMAVMAQDMVARAVDTYVARDAAAARRLAADDDDVDHLFAGLFGTLVAEMGQRPAFVRQGTHLLFFASHLERIADHATNVAEAVIYAVTGERPELND